MAVQELVAQLIEALEDTPHTQAEVDDTFGTRDIDAVVDATIAGRPVRIAVECKQQAFPRDILQAASQLRRFISNAGRGGPHWVPLLAARAISPGARELLREEGIGYFDTGGSLYLSAPGAFLFVDRPMPRQAERKAGVIFRGRRAQVLHAVWQMQREWFGVHQIAETAMVAPATASDTLATLERHGWVSAKGSGPSKLRRLQDPEGLLEAWAEHQSKAPSPRLRRFYVPAGSIQPLMRHLHEVCEEKGVPYEMTGEAAGQEYAPYLSSISQLRCRMLVGASAEAALRALDARPVDEGWNLAVMEADNEGAFVFRQMGVHGWLASPLQTYLDLLQGSGRAKEMAQHLRRERLQ